MGESASNEVKKKKLLKKAKYELVDYNSLPPFMRDNEFILRHYRSQWPIKHLFFSIFTIHNETLNVWTHLGGFFLFLALTIYTVTKVPNVVDLHLLQHFQEVLKKADLQMLQNELSRCLPSLPNMPDLHKLREELTSSLSSLRIIELLTSCLPERFLNGNYTLLHNAKADMAYVMAPLVLNPVTRWPFVVFLSGAMFCLLASSVCHLLSCHSEKLSYIVHRFDYAGIAALIATSFYPSVYYTFMCNPFFCKLYLGSITLLGICTVIVSFIPLFQKPEFRVMRTSLFLGMGLSGIIPVFHKLILFGDKPEAFHTTGYEVLMGVLYVLGALFYMTRIPERWMPGKFDILCNSHQIFHVFVVAAAYSHYQAGLIYLRWRDVDGC